MTQDLYLPLKREYFEQIISGEKTEEYRLFSPFWQKRLMRRKHPYRNIILTLGYPKKGDLNRTIVMPYTGFSIKEITHKHFGDIPVKVFAIKLKQNIK